MRTHVLSGATAVARIAASVVQEVVRGNAAAVIGWPTGRTAVPFYDELARRHRAGDLDLSTVRGFNLDELVLPRDDPRSFAAFMQRHAWERTGLDAATCDIPRVDGDLDVECRRYDRALMEAGGLDLAVLGVGIDGHVAYNLPGPPVAACHLVEVPTQVVDGLRVPARLRPLRALTLGMEAIGTARRILLMATGRSKERAVRALLDGPPDPHWPCSLLREHPRCDVIVDRAAAGQRLEH